jgi:UTP--glucose-1-phosphate uridylyltransferase
MGGNMSFLELFLAKMKKENLHPIVCQSFAKYYQQIINGATGKLSEKDIEQPKSENLIDYKNLTKVNKDYLDQLVVIKLNGGLGTSMGLTKAKSLLKVKEDFTFLDIIVRQILALRSSYRKKIPLLLMNSFNTQEDTLAFLQNYPTLKMDDLPLDFVQNKFPKIIQDDMKPLQNENEQQNWNPPGHGEIYTTMKITGILEQLIASGFTYAFISNSDNLGAETDPRILTHFAEMNIPFLMEVCQRTEMDKKGGHLAQTKTGQLILREVAQCPDEELISFQDIDKYSYFNTNNLWINLRALETYMIENDNFLPLPMILNKKKVDHIPVFQVETAMGAAIGIFEGSKAIVVPRSRFLPVKKTNDLLALWSDAFSLHDNFSLTLHQDRNNIPFIDLDENYLDIELMQAHFKDGVPSLKKCDSFQVKGDVYFGKNVLCEGNVKIHTLKRAFVENKLIKNETLFLC